MRTFEVIHRLDSACEDPTTQGTVAYEYPRKLIIMQTRTHEYAMTAIPSSLQVSMTRSVISYRLHSGICDHVPLFVSSSYDQGLTSISTAATGTICSSIS